MPSCNVMCMYIYCIYKHSIFLGIKTLNKTRRIVKHKEILSLKICTIISFNLKVISERQLEICESTADYYFDAICMENCLFRSNTAQFQATAYFPATRYFCIIIIQKCWKLFKHQKNISNQLALSNWSGSMFFLTVFYIY